jgi:predicted transposase YdaD
VERGTTDEHGPGRPGGRDRPARPFDATLKHLFDIDPRAWLAYVGLPADAPAAVIDADLSTVLAEADKVVRVDGPSPWLAHVELQATYDPALPARLLQYSALLHRRHGLPVASLVVLLRPDADGPAIGGTLELAWPGARYLTFDYGVVRTWRQPVERVLSGGLATLPLAPLADIAPEDLPDVIRRVDERLGREAEPSQGATIMTALVVLLGLRYTREVTRRMLDTIRGIEESHGYQLILERGLARGLAEGEARGRAEGEAAEARRLLLRLGTRKLGPPDRATADAIAALADRERLERMADRLLDASSWAEVLAAP